MGLNKPKIKLHKFNWGIQNKIVGLHIPIIKLHNSIISLHNSIMGTNLFKGSLLNAEMRLFQLVLKQPFQIY